MDSVTVVNRTSGSLEALWDGRVHIIPVGESIQPWLVALAAQRQNVLMGSQDPRENYNDFGGMVSLIAIREQRDDESPLEQNTRAIERWDRRYMPGGEEAVRIAPGRTGYGAVPKSPLPTASSFTPNPDSANIPKIPER